MWCRAVEQITFHEVTPAENGVSKVLGAVSYTHLQYRNETTNKECTRQLFAMDTVMSFTAYGKNSEQAVDCLLYTSRCV